MFSRLKMLWHHLVRRHGESVSTKSLGEKGEDAAARFLRRHGYKIVDRNVRFSNGELDLVTVHGRTVVFVEVKTRASNQKGEPWEAVDQRKREKLLELGQQYLYREDIADQKARFDIVSVLWENQTDRPKIEHLQNAFDGNDV